MDSVIQIFFNPLDASSRKDFTLKRGTPLIDFLQENYPDGFDGALRVFVGSEELAIKDLDYEIGDERVVMLVMPSGPETWGIVGAALVNALIAAAIGFVIAQIFAPETPGAFGGGDESPVYSLNPTRNEARLGEPVEVHYGTVSYPPSYAAAPYVYNYEGSNDQFVDQLMCLGAGKMEVEEIFIGESPFSTLEPGSVKYWVFQPQDHLGRYGRITDDIWLKVKDSEAPFPFREDVFTSPEVENFEWNDDVSEPITTTPITGSAFATHVDSVTGETIPGNVSGISTTLNIAVNDSVTLAGTDFNNISFIVDSVVNNGDGTQTLFQQLGSTPALVDEDPLNAAATLTTSSTISNMVAGPYRAQKLGQEVIGILCDVDQPNGSYYIDSSSGDIKQGDVVQVDFSYQRVDENTGAPIGDPIIRSAGFQGQTRTPLRYTVQSGVLPQGSYEVTATRNTPENNKSNYVNTTVWTGLKGIIAHPQGSKVYGDVTLLALRMKATNGLASASRQRIRVRAKRILDSGESDNPITVIKDIWSNSIYGMDRSLDEITEETNQLEFQWADSPKFNGSFDQRGTGYDNMQRVASMTGSRVVQDGQNLHVSPDKIQSARRALFSSANIVANTLKINYTFDHEGETDGMEVEYRDPLTFDVAYAKWPYASTNPERYVLFGCTDAAYALKYAAYLWNVRVYRRKVTTFTTDLEGLLPRFGDRIGVSSVMPDWGQSGVFVRNIDANTWMVDQALNWTGSEDYILLRDEKGVPTEPILVTQGDHPQHVVFSGPIPIDPSDGYAREPTSYAFGKQYTMVRDFIVSRLSPKGDNAVEVEGHVYDKRIYLNAPEHMSLPY